MQSKRVYDLLIPALATVCTSAFCWWLEVPLRLYGHATLTASLSSLLALLIAFYMAALAAVATFERKGIDAPLKGGSATLQLLNHTTGKRERKDLSYRQFIAYLFGYLSFLSLVLFLALLFFDTAWPKLIAKLSPAKAWVPALFHALDQLVFVTFVFGIWQMFVTSILGIYFLADRMQSLNDPQN